MRKFLSLLALGLLLICAVLPASRSWASGTAQITFGDQAGDMSYTLYDPTGHTPYVVSAGGNPGYYLRGWTTTSGNACAGNNNQSHAGVQFAWDGTYVDTIALDVRKSNSGSIAGNVQYTLNGSTWILLNNIATSGAWHTFTWNVMVVGIVGFRVEAAFCWDLGKYAMLDNVKVNWLSPTATPTNTGSPTVSDTPRVTKGFESWITPDRGLPWCAPSATNGFTPTAVASMSLPAPYYPTLGLATSTLGTSTLGPSPTRGTPTITLTPSATSNPLTATAQGTRLTLTPVYTWSITPTDYCVYRPAEMPDTSVPVADVGSPTIVSSVCLTLFPYITTDYTLFSDLHVNIPGFQVCPSFIRLGFAIMGVDLSNILALSVALVAARLIINTIMGGL